MQGVLGRLIEPRKALYGPFLDADGAVLDQGIALFFPAPHSYTGEDVLELQGHGGPIISQLLLRRCLELGARLADAGEFSKRAFLNDKMDLAQAEAVADLIDASSLTAARSALRSLSGEFSKRVSAISQRLIGVRTLVEAELDFSDEEIDTLDPNTVLAPLGEITDSLEHLTGEVRKSCILRSGAHVVLVGQPNVGKSSLLNCLAGEELAIVTDVPGTTRDAIRQSLDIHGVPLHFVDTAGLRHTHDKVEQIGISRTWDEIHKSDVVLFLVDSQHGIAQEDRDLLPRMPAQVPRVTVHNKCDLSGLAPQRQEQEDGWHVWISAKSGAGMPLLKQVLAEVVGLNAITEENFLGRERHLDALLRVQEHLQEAILAMGYWELVAEHLRLGHRALGEITGEFSPDDLLGEIFSNFCIGK